MHLVWIIALFVGQAQALSGNGVNNGGDAVSCRPSTTNSYEGYYSLDYLAQFDPALQAVEVRSLDDSLARMEAGLKAKLPELVPSFLDFKSGLFNETNPRHARFWEKAPFGLIDLKDENLVTRLPENCRDGEKVSIVQAVVRQPPNISGRPLDKFVYKYVPEVVDRLRSTQPIQLSFLILHEWLWDFSSNVERNRRLDYWLHSAHLENWSREEWLSNLEAIGFALPGRPEPAFSSAVCPVDAKAHEELLKAVQMGRSMKLGFGKAFKRTRLCSGEQGCGASASDSTEAFQRNMKAYIQLESSDGLLFLTSRESGAHANAHFVCRPQGARFACDRFANWDGYEMEPPLVFEVEVGRGCVRFVGQTQEPIFSRGRNDYQVDDYVLLFPELR
jgi:hypothetical protein